MMAGYGAAVMKAYEDYCSGTCISTQPLPSVAWLVSCSCDVDTKHARAYLNSASTFNVLMDEYATLAMLVECGRVNEAKEVAGLECVYMGNERESTWRSIQSELDAIGKNRDLPAAQRDTRPLHAVSGLLISLLLESFLEMMCLAGDFDPNYE